jgi:hypothetical protein
MFVFIMFVFIIYKKKIEKKSRRLADLKKNQWNSSPSSCCLAVVVCIPARTCQVAVLIPQSSRATSNLVLILVIRPKSTDDSTSFSESDSCFKLLRFIS